MKAIVKKDRSNANNYTIGYVKPIYVDDNGRWIRVADIKKQFPNNECIFIHRGYDNLNKSYEEDELFVLTYENNVNHRPDYDGSSQWASTGDKAVSPSNNEFCRILNSNRQFDATSQEHWIWQHVEPLNDIFIKTGEYLYGPFNFTKKVVDEEDAVNLLLRAEAEHGNCVFKVKTVEAERRQHVHQEGNYLYVVSVNALLNDSQVKTESIYYGSVSDLLDWAKTVTDLSRIVDIKQLKKVLETVTNLQSLEKSKLNRLQSLLSNSDDWFAKRLPQFIAQYLEENPTGKRKVEDYLKINEHVHPDQSHEIKQLQDALKQLKQQLTTAKDERLAALPEVDRKFIDQLISEEKLRDKYLQIKQLDDQIKNLAVEYEVKKRLLEERDNDLREKQALHDGLEKSLRKLKDSFSNAEEVRSKFFEVKPYVDWINGIVPTYADEEQQVSNKNFLESLKLKNKIQPFKEYLGEVVENMNKLERHVEFNDLANYLITVNQNFLTVFAGLPGVGKTSLVSKLALATGLKNRFLPISTARGWTSQRDLIGFYNAISNQFQRARTGLFDVLQLCDIGVRNNIDIPYWVLLDEANLSPMEHYWSDFMRFSDPDSDRVLRVPKGNGQDELNIGQGLRFIATINYDHTTEALSPRLLDRVSVIRLTAPEQLIKVEKTNSLPAPEDYYSMEQLGEILNPLGANYDMLGVTLNLFNEIRGLLENEDDGSPITINPRKQRDVSKYCTIAQHVFEDNGNSFNTLDFAFCQQILPLIAGRGERFGKKLNNLYDLINPYLPNSAATLKRIIKNGDNNYYNYRFFV